MIGYAFVYLLIFIIVIQILFFRSKKNIGTTIGILLSYILILIFCCKIMPWDNNNLTSIANKITKHIKESGTPNSIEDIPELPKNIKACIKHWRYHMKDGKIKRYTDASNFEKTYEWVSENEINISKFNLQKKQIIDFEIYEHCYYGDVIIIMNKNHDSEGNIESGNILVKLPHSTSLYQRFFKNYSNQYVFEKANIYKSNGCDLCKTLRQ